MADTVNITIKVSKDFIDVVKTFMEKINNSLVIESDCDESSVKKENDSGFSITNNSRDIDSIKDNNISTISNRETKENEFIPPTLEEIVEFCAARASCVKPSKFWKYYNDNRWMDKYGNYITDWKESLIKWEEREFGHMYQPKKIQRNYQAEPHPAIINDDLDYLEKTNCNNEVTV